MSKFDYGVIAIGSGSAGGAAAFVAKHCNVKVAVVEEFRDRLGGHCPNYACVPTKALLNAAKVYKLVKGAAAFGIHADNPRFDFGEVAKYRDQVVAQLTGPRIERNLHNAGIDLLWGHARFVSEHEIEVTDGKDGKTRRLAAENIVIGTGSREFVPPIEGLKESGFITSDQAVRFTELPESIIIVGAGPVGTEFAQVFSSFGVKVILLQKAPQILQREDSEIAEAVATQLREQGVEIVTGMDVASVQKAGGRKIVTVKVGESEKHFEAAEVMIAAGRRAHLDDLNLPAAGVAVTADGRLELNEYLQTSKAHIWAAGDAAGNWQFTHTAAYEGDLVGRNICHRHDEAVNYDVIPRVTFCDPEVASVGMLASEAEKKGLDVRVEKFAIGGLGRALIDLDRRGFVKLVADRKSNQILGGHIVGKEAGHLIHEIALAVKGKMPVTALARMIHAYPTYSEAVAAAAEKYLTFE